MNVKRILNLLLLVTLSLFVLSACSDDSDDSSSKTGSTGSSVDWDSILNGSTGTGSGSTNTDSNTDTNSEDEGTEGEGEGETDSDITDSEDVDTTDTEEADTTDTDTEEVVGSDSDSESDSESDSDFNTEDEVAAEVINNSYTVSELDIVYGELSTSSTHGTDASFYYNNNNLALSYDEENSTLTVVGKIEIVTSDMTYVSNLALNKLRYRYFNETITVSSLDTLYNEGDDTYTFTFPFELSGDDMIVYSEDSSNKLTFTLTDKADFPSDEESFTATSRSYTSVAYIDSDPYSIQGTYTASSTSCKGLMYYGLISGSQVDGSSQTLTISDIYAKIDENGNLTFTFDVSGFKSGTGYSIPANGSYNVSVDSGTWWGYDSYSLTGSHTYSGYKYNDTITISSTGYAKSLLVEGKSVYNGNSKYYGLIGGGTVDGVNNGKCYFTKQSDYVQ